MSANKKVTLLGEESDDGIEREGVWIMQLVNGKEIDSRYVVANQTCAPNWKMYAWIWRRRGRERWPWREV